jgi:uncharacterized iron-regulated membrane protein
MQADCSVIPLAFLNNIFGIDGLVVLIIGLLIFGRRLPEVGGNLWQTLREFDGGEDHLAYAVLAVLVVLALVVFFYRVNRGY